MASRIQHEEHCTYCFADNPRICQDFQKRYHDVQDLGQRDLRLCYCDCHSEETWDRMNREDGDLGEEAH